MILRPGPYICAEWDYGGYPYWIFKHCGEKIRTSDDKYLGLVDKWFNVLFPRLTTLFYDNGGPVVALQVVKNDNLSINLSIHFIIYIL